MCCSTRRPPTWCRPSELLLDLLEHYPDRRALVDEIKDREHEGDRVTHEIVQLINKTFITPIDREDIYYLATAIDDVCDFMDQVADELNLYGVEEVPPEAIEQAGVHLPRRRQAGRRHRGPGRPASDVHHHLIDIHTLEDEGDRIVRDGDRAAVLERPRPAGGDPLEGHPRGPRAGRRRMRARGPRARERLPEEPMSDAVLVAVIAIALAFDFTNGFHDTANAVATTVSTRALPPRIAVLIASLANFAGAFVSTAVASFICDGPGRARRSTHRPAADRRAAGRDRLEPRHLVSGAAVLVVARADRRPGRRRAGRRRLVGHPVARAVGEGGRARRSRARSSDSCWPAGSWWPCCGDSGARARRR